MLKAWGDLMVLLGLIVLGGILIDFLFGTESRVPPEPTLWKGNEVSWKPFPYPHSWHWGRINPDFYTETDCRRDGGNWVEVCTTVKVLDGVEIPASCQDSGTHQCWFTSYLFGGPNEDQTPPRSALRGTRWSGLVA